MILRDLEDVFKAAMGHVNPAYLSVGVFCGKCLSLCWRLQLLIHIEFFDCLGDKGKRHDFIPLVELAGSLPGRPSAFHSKTEGRIVECHRVTRGDLQRCSSSSTPLNRHGQNLSFSVENPNPRSVGCHEVGDTMFGFRV